MDHRRITLGRRSALLLGLASLTAATSASAGPSGAQAPFVAPLPAPPVEPRPTAPIRPVSYWAADFLRSWDYQYREGLPQSRSGDSWDHYNLSYTLDGCVAMFRATGERRYLDRALLFTEEVVATAAPSTSLPGSRFRDRYQGWASAELDGDEAPLYESYFWRYATTLLTAMRAQPAIHGDPGYRARYDRLLAFAEVHVFEKWHARGARDTIYRERTHMAAHWALIALNLSRLTGDETRRARCIEVADTIDAQLRGQLRRNPVEPTAYFWNDVWGSAERPGQDVSHGNGVIAYVAEARAARTEWTDADMAAFSALLTKVIWPGGRAYRGYVDGTGADNGWFADGFVKLGRFDPGVQLRLESHRVINDQYSANMALNARLLRA